MKRTMIVALLAIVLMVITLGESAAQEKEVQLIRQEIESMLFLFNETNVKGAEIDVLAPLAVKLKNGAQEAAALADTTQKVTLKLTPQEAQICISVINNSTFKAQFVELILGMKQKLQKISPPAQMMQPQ